jgi:hypothetical protein
MRSKDLSRQIRELRALGVIFEQQEEHRTGAFNAELLIIASFLIGQISGGFFQEIGKDGWGLIKNAITGALKSSSSRGADCEAKLTARSEADYVLRVRSPIQTQSDIDEFVDTAKASIWSFMSNNRERPSGAHGRISVSVSLDSGEGPGRAVVGARRRSKVR